MFNEIFIHPKIEKLHKKIEEGERIRQSKTSMRPHISLPLSSTRGSSLPNLWAKKGESIMKWMEADPLIKDQVHRFKKDGVNENTFQVSPLLERKRFIKKSENVFDEEDQVALDETLPDINADDIMALRSQLKAAGKTQYHFQDMDQPEAENNVSELENIIIRMQNVSDLKSQKKMGAFFTQQI